MARYVIVGGVAGGASAAARLRRLNEHDEIVLLERGNYVSFANCGLPYYIGGTIQSRNSLLVQTPEALRARFNIDVRINSNVTKVNRDRKTVTVDNNGDIYELEYDKLILSPGSSPIKPPLKGVDSENVFTVWTIPDTDKISSYLKSHKCKSAVVVGGGFIGVEMAENLKEIGLDVTIVEMLDQAMNNLDFEMAQFVHMELNAKGVHLVLGKGVTEIAACSDASGSACVVKVDDGQEIPADIVIMCVGVRPNSELAKDAGLEVGPRGHIVVDDTLRTSDPDIYAVGDAIEVVDFVTKEKTAVPLAGPANKQGRIAADNIMGLESRYAGTQGTSIAKVFDKAVASIGINEKRLQAAGKKLHEDYEIVYAHPMNHASYYPGGSMIHMKVIFEPATGKILGAQAVGESGTDKRIDVIATCMRLGGTTEDLQELELAYAPPFNTAKDPVNFVGYIAENIRKGVVEPIHWREVETLDRDKYQIVDVRTAPENAAGAIEGATLAPVDNLREMISLIDKDRTAVLICRSAVRSYIAARILTQNGYNAQNVMGGWLIYEAINYKPV
ncbi:MAG: FAD-dependent oxidoreductase [Clostridiales bacterium]|jgi:NADPH-dependent 2,4-dienoyl-CoA reductase/sulfur reductase-like enzyme/rhodanese-related sulfurtransferase|nr:FAD-dependent oxidoreductase [Clostridiales bacterium]